MSKAAVLSQLPDTGEDSTPDSVLAARSFKERLLRGEKVSASSFDGGLPRCVTSTDEPFTTQAATEDDFLDAPTPAVADESAAAFPGYPPEIHVGGKPLTFKDPMHALAAYLESMPGNEEIKVIGDFGKIGFKVTHVCINDFGVAFIIKKDAILFEPNMEATLKIVYRGQEYNVVYAGGFFTFVKMPFTFVSFIRVTA